MENEDIFGGNERALEQDIDRQKGGYGGDYFDENEHRAGQEKYDLSTGEKYTNDGDIETPHAVKEDDQESIAVLKKKLKEEEATEFLRKNGYDEFGNEKRKAA